MKNVTDAQFWDTVMTGRLNVHPSIVGNYPYTSVFKFPNGREHGRIVNIREDGRNTDHFFLTDATTDMESIRRLWKQGQSVASIQDTLGINLWVPGGISDLMGNMVINNFAYSPRKP